MSNKAQALIDTLTDLKTWFDDECEPQIKGLDRAIKAIELLKLIAEKGGKIDADGRSYTIHWCAYNAKQFFEDQK